MLDALVRHFDLSELHTLCFELEVDPELLGGEGKKARARELILYMQRHKRLEALVSQVIVQRPFLRAELADTATKDLYLPDHPLIGRWRRLPLSVRFVLGLGIGAVLILLGFGVFREIQGVLPGNPWGPDVPTATVDESLILVSGFRGPKSGDLLPEQRIVQALIDLNANSRDLDVRVELVPSREIATDVDAKAWGQAHNAVLVIWGWYDADRVQANLALPSSAGIRPVDRLEAIYRSEEDVSLALNQDLPEQVEVASQIALGWVAYRKGAYETAARLWHSAMQQTADWSPDDRRALYIDHVYVLRGTIAARRQNYALALADYQEAQRIAPDNLIAIYNAALMSYHLWDLDAAAAEVQRVIDASPAPPPELLVAALNLAAQIQAGLGHVAEAVQFIERAEAMAPEDPDVQLTLSGVYLLSQDWEGAVRAGERAAELNPSDPVAHLNLGRAYLHTGLPDKARDAYQAGIGAIKLPDDEWVLDAARQELEQDKVDFPNLAADIDLILTLLLEAGQRP